ncbi:hypothetical protein LIER_28958 [Lithospermum erythrorhizon]|uniref:Uncharacterized protein n=1 Tax=Lithospermum erythrorhizon TaxID=34254 RepID=A0AAV3RMF0_LITER
MYIMCGPRKFKFDLDDFERYFELPDEGFSDIYLQRDFPSDIPVDPPTGLNLLLNHNRENGRLLWYNKEERVARKRQRGVGGSGDLDESASEGEDAAARPRCSIHDQLNSLEEGQARLHRDFERLRDSGHRHQREQQSRYTGIVRFLTCWGKKQGSTDKDLAHLEIPSTNGASSLQ